MGEDEKQREHRKLDSAWVVAQTFSVLRRQKQANLCEFKTSLAYIVSSRTGATQRNPVSKHCVPQTPIEDSSFVLSLYRVGRASTAVAKAFLPVRNRGL